MGVLGMSVYLVTLNFISFFSNGVKTSRRQIFETPFEFPMVNVCNQNPITTKYGYQVGLSSTFPADLGVLNMSEQILLAHNFSDVLISCTFNNLPCYPSDFLWYFDRNLGNCYSFNSGLNASNPNQTVDLLTSIRAGADYGLQMVLYSGYYENLTLNNSYNG